MRSLPAALREISGVVAASRLERPPVPMVSSGIAAVDELTGGLPRGGLIEICGAASSGRTGLMMAALASATARGELCALIDVGDCFDPKSAEAAGVDLERLLWVRCGRADRRVGPTTTDTTDTKDRRGDLSGVTLALHASQQTGAIMPPAKVWYGRAPARSERDSKPAEQNHGDPKEEKRSAKGQNSHASPPDPAAWFATPAVKRWSNQQPGTRDNIQRVWGPAIEQALKAADLILQSGGFGMVVLDLGDVPIEMARRIPLTSWFRFSRAVENTPTVLLTIEREACAKSSATMVLRTSPSGSAFKEDSKPSHTRVFGGIESVVEVVRSRVDGPREERPGKKPPRAVRTEFASRTEWAG